MSKSHPSGKTVYAIVQDDDGAMFDLTCYTSDDVNMFEAIEQEAKERGIRYVTTMMFQFPDEG